MTNLSNPLSIAGLPSMPQILGDGAANNPHVVMATFENGVAWTWEDGLLHAEAVARYLQGRGICRGDTVGMMIGNGEAFLKAWWGVAMLGAIVVPFNTNLKGMTLVHARTVSGAKLTIVDPCYHERFVSPYDVAGSELIFTDVLDELKPAANREITTAKGDTTDPHVIIFTSGTTGPAKGSITSFAQLLTTTTYLQEYAALNAADTLLVDLPLYHLAAMSAVASILSVGGAIAVFAVPNLSQYWERARAAQVTVAILVGGMCQMLMGQAARAADTGHALRLLVCAPLPSDPEAFRSRFEIDEILTAYGSTESNTPIVLPPNTTPPHGTCGKVRTGFDVRLVDAFDLPVAPGEIGEAVIRCQTPWTMSQGYLGMPEATLEAWRNGWFHTGDMFRQDADGFLFFHDRLKDALRRRGENISSFEVEREVMTHPMVVEAACIGSKVANSDEEEVKVFIITVDGATLDLEQLFRYLANRMPHFMVPRFLEVVRDFPRTSSARIRKHELRDLGNSVATWDCVAAGLKVDRNGQVVTSPAELPA